MVVRGLAAGLVTALAGVASATTTDYQWVNTISSYGGLNFSGAESVTVDTSGNIWADDQFNSRLVKFDSNGNYVNSFSPPTSGMVGNDGLHADGADNIWVAFYAGSNTGVAEYDGNGAVVTHFNARSYPGGTLFAPCDVAADSLGNVWVADGGPGHVEKFNSTTGALLATYSTTNGAGFSASGLVIDGSNNVWITSLGGPIIELKNDGTFIQQFGSRGSGPGQMSDAEGMAFDPAGNLWVADVDNNRVEEFSASGVYLGQVGSAGSGPGQFQWPEGLAFDAAGNLWVADTANNRLQEFSPVPEPSTLLLLSIGAISLLFYAWRRADSS
jgi:streptogramin lyase